MKRLSTTTDLCVCQRAQSLRALPFRKPRPSALPSLSLVRVFRFRHLFHSTVVCRALPHSLGVSPRAFPPLNLHKARVRRNHGRLPSNGLIRHLKAVGI
jgi:hypothetical protein